MPQKIVYFDPFVQQLNISMAGNRSVLCIQGRRRVDEG
jgi:hypothetical protein